MRLLLLCVFLIIGCSSPPPVMRAPVVVAELDPSLAEPKLPLPNLLAHDPDTGLIEVTDAADANDAEKAFNAWLRTLNGFPVSSNATIDFSAALDATTLSETTVRLFDITSASAVQLTPKATMYDAEKKRLTISHLWQPGHSYAVALIGGPSGLKGMNGERVVGSAAFDLLRAKYPLVTCSDLQDTSCRSANPGIKGSTIADERKKAVKMEKARLSAAIAIEALEQAGVARDNLASVWTFRTQSTALTAPIVNFEPAVRAIPFPCDALLKDGHPALPEEAGDDELARTTKLQLSQLDGFSTTASIVTERQNEMGAVGFGLLGSSAQTAQLQLFDMDMGNEPVPVTLTVKTSPDQLSVKPVKALRSHHRYAVVWTKGVKTLDGRDIGASPAWTMLNAGAAFTEGNGKSRVRSLDDEHAADLERLRQSVVAGAGVAAAKGIAAGDVLLAWTFTTLTTGPTLAELRAQVTTGWMLPTSVSNVQALPQISQLSAISSIFGKDFHSQIRSGFEGNFVTGNALNPNGTELDLTNPSAPVTVGTEGPFFDIGSPRVETLKFLLVLPKTPKHADGRIPIIIFQHGITRFRRDALFIANAIAKKGYATLAIDHPLHGDRCYCASSADCASGMACENHRCPPGGYRIASGLDAQLGTPAVSGLKFSSTTNLAATRDQIRQLVIDTAQLIRVVKDTTNGIGAMNVDDAMTAGVTERLEVGELGYIGMSLGSVMGTLAVAANPEITRATFNVGGASPADILTQATVSFLATKKQSLDAYLMASRGIATGSQAYADFYDVARWMLDLADAQNFGRNYIDEPLPAYPKKRVFLSWVDQDPWVPNATTQLLIDSIERTSAPMNFGQHKWTEDPGNHSFMLDPSSAICLPAQDEAVGWIDAP